MLKLTDALGLPQLGPVPVAVPVAPAPPLPHQRVAGVAVELNSGLQHGTAQAQYLDSRARHEGECRLATVAWKKNIQINIKPFYYSLYSTWGRQRAAGNHHLLLLQHSFVDIHKLVLIPQSRTDKLGTKRFNADRTGVLHFTVSIYNSSTIQPAVV